MHLVSYNIQFGLGKDGRFDTARQAGEIGAGSAAPDLIALQEVVRNFPLLGIADQARVEIASSRHSGKMRAYVTDLIHPECVFLLHGFGHQAKRAERSYNKGVSDAALQENLYDKVGGSPAYHDTFVNVKAA